MKTGKVIWEQGGARVLDYGDFLNTEIADESDGTGQKRWRSCSPRDEAIARIATDILAGLDTMDRIHAERERATEVATRLPCCFCGSFTTWTCADCGIDGVIAEERAVCGSSVCRDRHEAERCTASRKRGVLRSMCTAFISGRGFCRKEQHEGDEHDYPEGNAG